MISGMDQEYRWSDTRDVDAYRLPGPEHLGRWATAAMLVSLLLHVLVFFAMDHVKIALGIQQPEEISTGQINVRQVEVRPYEPDNALPPEETITPPNESAALLEEVDLLDLLPEDTEIDIAPDVVDPAYALKISNPLAEGELDAPDTTVSSSFDLDADLPDFGRMESELKPAAVGQITVDPGAVQVDEPGRHGLVGQQHVFLDQLMRDIVLDALDAQHFAVLVEPDLVLREVEIKRAVLEAMMTYLLRHGVRIMQHLLSLICWRHLNGRKRLLISKATLRANHGGIKLRANDTAILRQHKLHALRQTVHIRLQ
jgi:hypothetical protein